MFKAKALTDLVLGKLPTPNLMILEPPRIGKTDLGVKAFVPWSWSYFPDSEYIIGGYGADMATANSVHIKNTLGSAWYQAMVGSDWGCHVAIRGGKASGRSDYFHTLEGGVLKAVGRGGGATGFGAGKLRPEFGGLILCFPYAQNIITEKGPLPIGEIVEKKIKVNILSKNLSTGEKEYKPIDFYYKNPGSDIYEIGFDNGFSIKCTPFHKIYTENRGYVEAINLKKSDLIKIESSDSIYRGSCDADFSGYKSFGISNIANKIQILIRKVSISINPFIHRPRIFSDSRPSFTNLYLADSSRVYPILFCYNRCFSNIKGYGNSIRSCYFSSRSFFVHWKSTVFFSISNIFRSCAVFKIGYCIIFRVPIKMSYFHSFWSWAKKSKRYGYMKIHGKMFSIYASLKNTISTFSAITICFKYFFSKDIGWLVRPRYNPSVAFGPSKVRNRIPGISRYANPNFIRKVGHKTSTYCLNVRNNHNMFVGESQCILASNCDDPLKAQEGSSAAVRKEANTWIMETLHSRRNRLQEPTTPIVLIMQRLHPDDPAGHLLKTERHRWTIVQIPAHNEKGQSIWEERISSKELQYMKDYAPDVYHAQYMQEPIADGYNIFKAEWWGLWDDRKAVEKKITWKFITGDTAFKAKDSSDYSVFQCWGAENTRGLYLMDQIRGKWEFPELVRQIKAFKNKHTKNEMGITPATELWIEDKASGTSLVQTLRAEGIPCNAWGDKESDGVSGDKAARAKQTTLTLQQGREFVPDPRMPGYEWVDIFVGEHVAFTSDDSHAYDDQVDTRSMANLIWQKRGGGVGPLPTWNNLRKYANGQEKIYRLE